MPFTEMLPALKIGLSITVILLMSLLIFGLVFAIRGKIRINKERIKDYYSKNH